MIQYLLLYKLSRRSLPAFSGRIQRSEHQAGSKTVEISYCNCAVPQQQHVITLLVPNLTVFHLQLFYLSTGSEVSPDCDLSYHGLDTQTANNHLYIDFDVGGNVQEKKVKK